MTAAPTPARVASALVTAVTTTAWYASPDLVRSRRARAGVKAALCVVVMAAGVPEFRRSRVAAREAAEAQGLPTSREVLEGLSASRKAALAAAAVVLLGGSTALTVVGERWMFRRGERRAAAGVPWAHTRAAVPVGLVTAALALVPDPSDARPDAT
ncbi:peptidase S9 [Cellulomonas endophytica]|uniref:peptidase S9 n=1 Tax=Cellulomonas endophytica TaxID=2494735 RepID=UPI0010123EA1|nr:peptidase S9 [Cellulomonas endophytica]